MSAYYRMSDAILDCPCSRELGQAVQKGDSCGALRQMLMIRILCLALSPSKLLTDAQALAICTGAPIRQAERVWETCIRHKVLRKSGYGYSAREWLSEQGFIGRYEKKDAFSEGMHGS